MPTPISSTSSAALQGDAFARVHAGAHEAATSPLNRLKPPTAAQAKAGNYRLGTTSWQSMQIRIENPAHTTRTGVDENGNPWISTVQAHYGYLAGTRGADGDGIDIFLGPAPESPVAWIINQTTADGRFDEHKVMAGFSDEHSALRAYRHSYAQGWNRFDPKPIRVTARQLRWWAHYGDKSRRFQLSQVPSEKIMDSTEATAGMPRVFWDSAAMPAAGLSLAQVLYRIREADGAEGLIFDPMTMAELTAGHEVETLDALVTEAGKLKPKMELLMRLMEGASDTVKPVAVQFSDVLRRYGGAHVAAIYELSDGQTITVWFHNPDATPAKFTPADTLVSWKWLLNKRDITITVAAENGGDLNPREVARRIMRLAEKNSAAFAKANATRTARMEKIQGLKDALAEGQERLSELHGLIEAEKAAIPGRQADRAKAAELEAMPAWKRPGFDPVSEDGYELIWNDEAALLYWQDRLDATWSGRIVDIRNALRALGWDGAAGEPLSKGGFVAGPQVRHIGAGRNVVGINWEVKGIPGAFMSDGLSMSAEELAGKIDLIVTSHMAQIAEQEAAAAAVTPEPIAPVDPEPVELEPAEPAPAAPSETPEVATLQDASAARDAAKAYFDALRGSSVYCQALAADVAFRLAGFKKIMSTSADVRKLALIKVLPTIIKSGKKLGSRRPYNGDSDTSAKAYHTLRAEAKVDGQPVAVRVVIKEDTQGAFHYDHTVYEAEAIFDGAMENGSAQTDPSPETASNGGSLNIARTVSHQRVPAGNSGPTAGGEILLDDGSMVKVGMVVNLFIEGEPSEAADDEQAAEPPEVATLREVAAGRHDSLGVSGMYAKISEAVQSLGENLTAAAAEAADAAILHWVEVEEAAA